MCASAITHAHAYRMRQALLRSVNKIRNYKYAKLLFCRQLAAICCLALIINIYVRIYLNKEQWRWGSGWREQVGVSIREWETCWWGGSHTEKRQQMGEQSRKTVAWSVGEMQGEVHRRGSEQQ